MRAPGGHYPHRYPDALGLLRLRLTEESHLAVADGIWLPYGRDLVREGAHLVDEFPERRGRIDRLAYPRSDWEDAASEIFTRHGRIKVGLLPQARGGGSFWSACTPPRSYVSGPPGQAGSSRRGSSRNSARRRLRRSGGRGVPWVVTGRPEASIRTPGPVERWPS